MKKFKIEFVAVQKSLYNATIEAKTPEEALKLFRENPYDYENDEDEGLDFDIDESSAKVYGEWIEDKKDPRFSSLKRFDPPIE